MIQCTTMYRRYGDVPIGCLICLGCHLLKFKGNSSSYKDSKVQVTIVFWGAVQKYNEEIL